MRAGLTPEVSIVIPFLNAERFMREALDSVVAQEHGRWEVLLVNDGSSDGSEEIAREFVKDNPGRTRYLEHPNGAPRGISASRNLAVRHARGRYIAPLDADDVWLPGKLREQTQILEAHGEAGMCVGASEYWHSWSPAAATRDIVRGAGPSWRGEVPPPVLLWACLEGRSPSPPPSDILVRRDVVDGVGGFEEVFGGTYQLYEDQAFLAKVFISTRVFVEGKVWDKYRLHPWSCSAAILSARGEDTARRFYLRWLRSYLLLKRVRDRSVWRAVRFALLRYEHPVVYAVHPRRWMRLAWAAMRTG